jgi:hypothetical protein
MANGSYILCKNDAYELLDTSMIQDPIADVAGGGNYYYALTSTGRLYGWGQSSYLGVGDVETTSTLVAGQEIQIRDSAISNRRITQIVANSYSTWVLAPLEVDPSSEFTTTEISVGATYFTVRGFGFGGDSYPYMVTFLPPRAAQCGVLEMGYSLPDVILCRFRVPMSLTPGGNFSVIVSIPAVFETTLPHLIMVAARPAVTEMNQTIPINARRLVIRGTGFGSNKNEISFTLSSGTCNVITATDTAVECEIRGSGLELGNLIAIASRLGSASVARSVGAVEGPATISSKRYSIPEQASYVRIFGRNFGSVIAELEVNVFINGSAVACNVTALTAASGPDNEQSVTCIPNAPLIFGSLKASISRFKSTQTDSPLVGTISSRPAIAATAANGKYALNAANITITGAGFFSSLEDISVFIRVTSSSRRRAADIPCVPTAVSLTDITCTLSSPLTSGSLSAQVSMYGDIGAPFSPIGVAVPAPAAASISSNYRVAQNAQFFKFLAYNVILSESTIDVTPSGSCSNRTVTVSANVTQITCYLPTTSVLQLGVLNVAISAFGGSSGATQIATVIESPSIVSDPSKKYFVEDKSGISFAGQNFDDPSGASVVLTVNNLYEKFCLVRASESTATTIVCDLDASDSLNNTGSLTAVVTAFGGKSVSTPIGVVERRDSSSVGLSTPEKTGIGVAVAAFAIIIIIIAIVAVVRSRRQGMRGEKAPEIPDDMRGLFSIKASDITLLNKLGEGSYGAVYLGKYKGKFVAVKKLANAALATATNEFFREASLMMSINPHPNVIKLYEPLQHRPTFSCSCSPIFLLSPVLLQLWYVSRA